MENPRRGPAHVCWKMSKLQSRLLHCSIVNREGWFQVYIAAPDDISRSGPSPRSPKSKLVSASWASEVFPSIPFSVDASSNYSVSSFFSLQFFQGLELAGPGDLHPALARPPLVEGRTADAVLAAQISRRHLGSPGERVKAC